MTCIVDDEDKKTDCDPSDGRNDETYVQDFFDKYLHGMIQIDDVSFRYAQGQFGTRMEDEDSYDIVPQSKHGFHDFCNEESLVVDDDEINLLKNKAVMINRGGCNFSKKAENLGLVYDAKMMILVNDDGEEFVMGAESDHVASKIHIAAVMVSNETGNALNEMVVRAAARGNDDVKIVIKLDMEM